MHRRRGSPSREGAPAVANLGVALVIACAILLGGCAAGGTGGATPTRSIDLLTAQQLREGTTAANLYDAILALRPQWLRGRGPVSFLDQGPDEPAVYVDGIRYGSAGDLRQIEVERVGGIEFLDALQATIRFGIGHTGGAIMVDVGPS